MSASNNRHVVPNADGGWDVETPDAQRASSHHATQAEAIDRAREIVRNAGGGELIIHREDGRIRESDTVSAGGAGAAFERERVESGGTPHVEDAPPGLDVTDGSVSPEPFTHEAESDAPGTAPYESEISPIRQQVAGVDKI